MSLAMMPSSGLLTGFPTGSKYKQVSPCVVTGDLVVNSPKPSAFGPTVLWDIHAGSLRLHATKPVTVHLRSEGAYWFAENETLRVFAYGATVEEALEDFQEHVVYFHSYYKSLRADQVIGEGERLKQLFDSSFVRA